MSLKRFVVISAIALIGSPVMASADGFVSPYIGGHFGNPSAEGRVNFGASVGWMHAGKVGAALDVGYGPSFFGNVGTFGSNSVTTVMGNLIVGAPVGGPGGYSFRPYLSGGVGLIRSTMNIPGSPSGTFSNNDFGTNLGAGVMGFLNEHVGVRGDVRYFRNLKDNSGPNDMNIDFGSFHFWRGSLGLAFRF